MGKNVPLDDATLAWAHDAFREYYRTTPVEPPSRFARREFAAFPFSRETLMRRHAAFRSAEEFREFLAREAPRHVYYSSAYYRFPDRANMRDKEWLGADLIFDLDADHLRGAERLGYAEQLALVKERVRALLDDFLLGDLGLDRSQTSLVFSGGRGYHVHVHDEGYLGLTSPERREIVEYVQGVGFDPLGAVRTRREGEAGSLVLASDGGDESPGGRGSSASRRARSYRRLAEPDAPGWSGRTTRAVLNLLARWEREGSASATRELEEDGVPHGRARRLARELVEEGKGRRIRETLSLEVFPGDVPKEFLEAVLRRAAVEVQGETDAPVTTDIHRLIRLPRSLHGGTGLRVVPLPLDALDGFDPLRDAVFPTPDSATARVELLESVDHPVAPRPIRGAAGELLELPTGSALLLVLRGEARLRT